VNGKSTLWSMLLTRANIVACSKVGNPTNIYIPASEGKTRTSVTFQTDGNIPISLHGGTTWCIYHSDTFPQFIPPPLFCYIIHKIAIWFRHWSSRAMPGTPASSKYN
jgi:hypothetical protein